MGGGGGRGGGGGGGGGEWHVEACAARTVWTRVRRKRGGGQEVRSDRR